MSESCPARSAKSLRNCSGMLGAGSELGREAAPLWSRRRSAASIQQSESVREPATRPDGGGVARLYRARAPGGVSSAAGLASTRAALLLPRQRRVSSLALDEEPSPRRAPCSVQKT